MELYLSVVAIFICSFTIMWYAGKIFKKSVSLFPYLVTATINTGIFYIYLSGDFSKEKDGISLLMILVYIAIFIEFSIVFEGNMKSTLFGVLTFGTFIYTIFGTIIAVTSLLKEKPVYQVLNDSNDITLVRLLSFVIITILLLVIYYTIPIKVVEVILSNEGSTEFAIWILFLISAYLCINEPTLNMQSDNNMVAFFHLKAGIIGFFAVGLVVLYANIFSEFLIKKKVSEKLTENISTRLERMEEWEKNKNLDSLTGVYTRNIAEDLISDYLNNNISFYVIFMDIDGLKYVNDKYGHEEGDFYIRKVSDIIRDVFSTSCIARFGGDEFVVVTEDNNVYNNNLNTNVCYESVLAIEKQYQKPYPTSISYGMVNVKKNSHYDVRHIIKIADERMYEFKIRNKKQRV